MFANKMVDDGKCKRIDPVEIRKGMRRYEENRKLEEEEKDDISGIPEEFKRSENETETHRELFGNFPSRVARINWPEFHIADRPGGIMRRTQYAHPAHDLVFSPSLSLKPRKPIIYSHRSQSPIKQNELHKNWETHQDVRIFLMLARIKEKAKYNKQWLSLTLQNTSIDPFNIEFNQKKAEIHHTPGFILKNKHMINISESVIREYNTIAETELNIENEALNLEIIQKYELFIESIYNNLKTSNRDPLIQIYNSEGSLLEKVFSAQNLGLEAATTSSEDYKLGKSKTEALPDNIMDLEPIRRLVNKNSEAEKRKNELFGEKKEDVEFEEIIIPTEYLIKIMDIEKYPTLANELISKYTKMKDLFEPPLKSPISEGHRLRKEYLEKINILNTRDPNLRFYRADMGPRQVVNVPLPINMRAKDVAKIESEIPGIIANTFYFTDWSKKIQKAYNEYKQLNLFQKLQDLKERGLELNTNLEGIYATYKEEYGSIDSAMKDLELVINDVCKDQKLLLLQDSQITGQVNIIRTYLDRLYILQRELRDEITNLNMNMNMNTNIIEDVNYKKWEIVSEDISKIEVELYGAIFECRRILLKKKYDLENIDCSKYIKQIYPEVEKIYKEEEGRKKVSRVEIPLRTHFKSIRPRIFYFDNILKELFVYNIEKKTSHVCALKNIYLEGCCTVDSELGIYIIGGRKGNGTSIKDRGIGNNMRIRAKYNEMEEREPLIRGRGEAAAVYIHGYIYVIGGADVEYLDSCEMYDIANDRWEPIANLLFKGIQLNLCAFQGRYIYSFGGYGHDSRYSKEILQYTILTNIWITIKEKSNSSFPYQGAGGSVQISQEEILIFGGVNSPPQNSFRFSPNGGLLCKTVEKLDLFENFSTPPLAVIKGVVYLFSQNKLKTIHSYNIQQAKWTSTNVLW